MGRTSLVAGSVLIGIGLLELVLRLCGAGLAAGSSARFELDPDLIYRLRARHAVSWSTAEFTEVSHTNALGMRGAEVGPKGSGETRILAIGDSFTYGHGVQDDETYPAVLERELRAGTRDVRVLNAGVPGYNTDQSYARILRDGLALAPDLVLVGVHCSDISDNYESSLYDVVHDGANARLVRRDARHTRMYQLGSVVGVIPAVVRQSRVFDLLVASLDWHDAPAERPPIADLDAWSYQKIRLEVADLHARGRPNGMSVAMVLMPCKKALVPGTPDPYGPLAHELAAAGVPVLESAPALRRTHPDLAPLFFRDDPHLNAGGNRALAAVTAEFLAERRLLAPGKRP